MEVSLSSASSDMSVLLTMSLILFVLLSEMHMCGCIFGGHCLRMNVVLSLFLLVRSIVPHTCQPFTRSIPMRLEMKYRDSTASLLSAHHGQPPSLNSTRPW